MHHAYGRPKCFEKFMGYEILNTVKILGLLFHCMAPCCLVNENMFKISKKPASSILKVNFAYIPRDIPYNSE
jgi:hypothetical protein